MSSNNIKTAQFGGVGGGYNGSPYSPGKSPIGNKGGNPGGWEINNFGQDKGFNAYLSKMHIEPRSTDENIEALLGPQHSDYELTKNYTDVLTPEQRQKEELRSKLNAYKNSLMNEADSIRKNSPAYIKEFVKTKPEHLRTLEESLADRHQYSKGFKSDREDESPAQEKPSRYHIAITDSQIARIAADYPSKRRNEINYTYPGEENTNHFQFDNPSLAKTPVLTEQREIDQYFKDLKNVNTPDEEGKYEEGLKDTVLTLPSPDTLPNIYPPDTISKTTPLLDVNLSTEANLNQERTDNDRFKRNNPNLKEKMDLEDLYEGEPWYGFHTNQVFK